MYLHFINAFLTVIVATLFGRESFIVTQRKRFQIISSLRKKSPDRTKYKLKLCKSSAMSMQTINKPGFCQITSFSFSLKVHRKVQRPNKDYLVGFFHK